MDGTAAATGVCGVAAGGPALGRKNMSGETLPPALMPEQPVPSSAANASIASRWDFQFNLTCPV